MPANFIDLSNEITKLTDTNFNNTFDLPTGACNNRKVFVVLDDESKAIEQIYERLSAISRPINGCSSKAYYITNSHDAEKNIVLERDFDTSQMLDVIFVMHTTENLNKILSNLKTKIINKSNAEVMLPSIFVRFVFFRLFRYDENLSPKSLTDYYKSETRKLAGILFDQFSDRSGKISNNYFVGSRIYNYLFNNESNQDLQCLNFADTVFNIACMDNLCQSSDISEFKKDDFAWYTFKIKKMYIPEYIILFSLLKPIRELMAEDSEVFMKNNENMAKRASEKICSKLKISAMNQIDDKLDDMKEYVPMEVGKDEFDNKTREVQNYTKGFKLGPFTIVKSRPDGTKRKVRDYEETPLNSEKEVLMKQYLNTINVVLSDEEFYKCIFDSFDNFIQAGPHFNYDLVEQKVRSIVEIIFNSSDEKSILSMLKQKYLKNIRRYVEHFSKIIQESSSKVYESIDSARIRYRQYFNGLTHAVHPDGINFDIHIHDLTEVGSIYEQIVRFLDNDAESFAKNWKDESDLLKGQLTLDNQITSLPLVSNADTTVIADNKTNILLSDFEKRIKRESTLYYIKCDSIDQLRYGIINIGGEDE